MVTITRGPRGRWRFDVHGAICAFFPRRPERDPSLHLSGDDASVRVFTALACSIQGGATLSVPESLARKHSPASHSGADRRLMKAGCVCSRRLLWGRRKRELGSFYRVRPAAVTCDVPGKELFHFLLFYFSLFLLSRLSIKTVTSIGRQVNAKLCRRSCVFNWTPATNYCKAPGRCCGAQCPERVRHVIRVRESVCTKEESIKAIGREKPDKSGRGEHSARIKRTRE